MPAFGTRCKGNKILGLFKTSLWISIGFFSPCSAGCSLPPPAHCNTLHSARLHFNFCSLRELSSVLLFFWKLFFLWPRTSGWCHSPFLSFLFLLASSPRLLVALPLLGWEVLLHDTQLQQHPAPASDKCQSCAWIPSSRSLLTDVPESCSGSFTGSLSRYKGCQEFMLNC